MAEQTKIISNHAPKTFNTEFEIFFEDISPAGKVHIEKITEWMSMARERYFKVTCPDHFNFVDRPVKMFTAKISINIYGTCRWADTITAVLTTACIKKFSFEMHIDFINQRTNQLVIRGLQKVAFVDVNCKVFANIPDDMKRVIVNYSKQGNDACLLE